MTKIPVHEIADFEGNIDLIKLFDALNTGGVTLLGLDMRGIHALRTYYLLRGGALPITKESISALIARPEATRVPPGWKLVPLLPTEAMIQAGYEACRTPYEMSGDRGRAQVCYTDMVIAAPDCSPQHHSEKP